MAKNLSLPLQSDPGRFGQDGDPRLVNVYVEKRGTAERASKQEWAHYAAPGLALWSNVTGASGCRGVFAVDASRLIAVIGQKIVSVDAFGTVTDLGGLLGTRGVFFARNLKSPNPQIVIVGDSQKKVIEGTTVSTISDPDLPPANSCDFLNRYVLFFHASGRFSYSEINAADSIAALSYYIAEGKPDGLVRGKVFGNQVWLLGTETTEIWGLTENADNPFRRLDGTYIDIGCIAPHSVVQVGQRLAWVANDYTVRMASGYETEIVSTPAVSAAIEALADHSTIEANVVTLRGHQFLRLNSPSWTWVMNVTKGYGLWHEEASIGSARRRAAYGAQFAGRFITGDTSSGKLWAWDANSGVDGDSPLMCRVVTAPQHVYPGEVEFNALYVDGIAGSGLNTPSNPVTNDPVMLVRDSDDGGASWSNELSLAIGRMGQTRTRTVAHQLGTSGEDGRMFEFRWDAAANKAIVSAAVDAVGVAA
jgi:hypothetical protein